MTTKDMKKKQETKQFPVPKLTFENWKWVAIDGLPTEDWWWCLIMWQDHEGNMEVHVGSYFEERKEFYVNFGLGGSVLEADCVVGWVSFDDMKWDIPDAKDIPLPETVTMQR